MLRNQQKRDPAEHISSLGIGIPAPKKRQDHHTGQPLVRHRLLMVARSCAASRLAAMWSDEHLAAETSRPTNIKRCMWPQRHVPQPPLLFKTKINLECFGNDSLARVSGPAMHFVEVCLNVVRQQPTDPWLKWLAASDGHAGLGWTCCSLLLSFR